MGQRVALCVDEESIRNPGLIGLEGEQLDSQEWLEVFATGAEARQRVAEAGEIAETWVVSCDDVEPINLAASIKSDAPEQRVCLVTADACGSLFSRAHTAQIDEVLEFGLFPRRYAEVKRASAEAAAGQHDEQPEEVEAPVELLEERPVERAPVVVSSLAVEEAVVLERPTFEPSPMRLPALQTLPQPHPMAVSSDNRAFVLTVVSGSGGAGKSSVSALGAMAAHRMGYRTLLLDCDLQFGDAAAMVGERHPVCLDEVLMRPDRLETDVMREGALSVLAAPSRLEVSEEAVRHLPALFERLVGMFDVIVVNTGASWAEQHAILLERSSAALFLIDQRVSSVRACQHALELCARCGIAANPFQFALNRCAKGVPLTSIDVSCALQGASVFELKDGGRDVEDYLSAGGAADLLEMRNEFAKSVENVIDRLLPAGDRRLVDRVLEVEERRPSRRRIRRAAKKRGEK